MSDEVRWVRVATVEDVPPGTGFETDVEVDGEIVGLFNLEGTYVAVGECTHERGPMSQGALEGDVVVCPWHGAKFNVRTGECIHGPVACRVDGQVSLDLEADVTKCPALHSFEVKVEGRNVFVRAES